MLIAIREMIKDDLNKIIKFIGKENILSSDDFFIKMKDLDTVLN